MVFEVLPGVLFDLQALRATMNAMPVTITLDPARQDLDAIHRILAGTYWSPGIRRDIVAEALRNSITAVAIEDATGETIGLARVVTDRATFAWLCDVFVDDRYRGQGVARRMLETLESHPPLVGLRRWCLVTRDAAGLYEKFGYTRIPPERLWMEKVGPKERWQEPAAH
jgi:N-acetylglutamate synthase-like GNAT family acetyltransferase